MSNDLFPIVFEDEDWLVVHKPADLVCHPTKGDARSSLISRVRLYLGPGSAPQFVNRLDRETSGLVVCAKHAAAARDLRRIWESRQVTKRYLAIVHGNPVAPTGWITAPLGPDPDSPVAIKDRVRPDGAPAETRWEKIGVFRRAEGEFALLRVEPLTGRKHQIRIHLAHGGHPVVGDKLYGGDEQAYLALVERRLTEAQRQRLILPCQALHAAELEFVWRGETRRFKSAPEAWFVEFLPPELRTDIGLGRPVAAA